MRMSGRGAVCGVALAALAAAGGEAHGANRAPPSPPAPIRTPDAAACDGLKRADAAGMRIDGATAVAAGALTLPDATGPGPAPDLSGLPAFCRVAATLTPTADSDIAMELWLPQTGWNGKFMMVGNGGWSGSIVYAAMVEPLRRGYAVASTDTGHKGGRGTFAFGHPEKLTDFAWRAVHLTTVEGKALTAAFYGQGPRYAYWNGCSSGGKQGLKELQRFPADYDGAIVGAPANNWMRLQAQSLLANLANLPPGRPPILGPAQFAILHKGVLDQCDAADGRRDGEVEDPRVCRFKAESLVCKPGQDAAQCLTPEQARVADRLYAPVRDPKTGALIYPGMPPGSEMIWGFIVSRPWDTGVDTYALAHNDPNWSFRAFDVSADVPLAEAWDPGIMAATPDLSAFKARGGKVIQYHGWADPFIPTENSINYYESVVAAQGGLAKTQQFDRLFLVPAMGHCGGAYAIDWITPLERWVEAGQAPQTVMATPLPPRDRPVQAAADATPHEAHTLCLYPQVARPHGARSWTCEPAPRGARAQDAPARLGDRIASR